MLLSHTAQTYLTLMILWEIYFSHYHQCKIGLSSVRQQCVISLSYTVYYYTTNSTTFKIKTNVVYNKSQRLLFCLLNVYQELLFNWLKFNFLPMKTLLLFTSWVALIAGRGRIIRKLIWTWNRHIFIFEWQKSVNSYKIMREK